MRGSRRHTNIAALAPQCDAATDIVDELVFFDAILRPFRAELKLFGPLLL